MPLWVVSAPKEYSLCCWPAQSLDTRCDCQPQDEEQLLWGWYGLGTNILHVCLWSLCGHGNKGFLGWATLECERSVICRSDTQSISDLKHSHIIHPFCIHWLTNLSLHLFIRRDRDISLLAEEGSRNRGSIQIALGSAVWWELDEIVVWIWRTQRKLSETVRINLIWALGSKASLWAAQYF